MRLTTTIVSLISLCLVGACGEVAVELDARPPMALEDGLAYFDAPTNSLVAVHPAGGVGIDGRKAARFAVGEAPVTALSVPRPDDRSRHQIIVVDPGAEQVHLVRNLRGDIDSLDAGVPLQAVDVADDGRWAVVYQPDGATPTRSLFAFPNTISVVDLHPDRPRATTLRLGESGARPLRAVFADSMELRDVATDGSTVIENVPLALVFVPGGVVPVDLERAVAGQIVPLTDDDPRSSLPAEVLFTNNRGDGVRGDLDGIERAFVRTSEGELYTLALSLSASRLAGSGAEMAVTVAVENVITPDAEVSDAELFFDTDGNALLLAAATDEVILVNGFTGVASRFPQQIRVDALARFTDPGSGSELALAWSRTEPTSSVLRLDPLGLEQRRSTGVETVRLGGAVSSIDIAAHASRAVLHYVDQRDLGVFDLARGGAVLDLRFAHSPSTRALSPRGEVLWVVGQSPEDDEPHLASVHLDGQVASEDVRLDRPGRRVGLAGGWVFVDHDAARGAVTFFPQDDLTRESAVTFEGILLTDLFDTDAPKEDDHD